MINRFTREVMGRLENLKVRMIPMLVWMVLKMIKRFTRKVRGRFHKDMAKVLRDKNQEGVEDIEREVTQSRNQDV